MEKLKIDPDFKALIPPLSDEELQQLEQNILAEGCRDAIKAWRGYIIDGHNRFAICQKHGLKYDVQHIPFVSKADAKIWIADNQLGRRNLTAAVKIEIACQKAELLTQGNKRKQIARDAGVSESTVQKYITIWGSGSADLVEQVRNGEMKISTAHKELYMDEKTVETLYQNPDITYVTMLSGVDGLARYMVF